MATTVLLVLFGVVLVAALLQTAAGFGFALLTMPIAVLLLGVRSAAPLIALVGFTLYVINFVRYRGDLNRRTVLRLALPAILGIPVGVWALGNLPEDVVKAVLGVLLITYALYALARPQAPPLRSDGWIYPVGFASGCLGGAFNTPGPPVIVFGSLQRWPRQEFRSVLQAVFLLNSTLVLVAHLGAGNLTRPVLLGWLTLAPAALLGVLLGSRLDRRLSGEGFRRFVVGMIFVLGVSLLL
ncbi:MAG: sulfite exporter TauE/SafE family protein [Caldilineales bacterium]|nr:sulfite exporter TauE/SafE family protein [Caldilineales bacterium]MDW8317587.1 sulfite exporter TauE/SafE family protein [Anaerolineae bacterium]